VLAAAILVVGASVGRAQDATKPAPGSAAFAPDSGAMAPDFTFRASNRTGVLTNPMKLSDFRGQTVVLAFFPKARTKG
jgi:peroxiredoxin Q/BCP